MLLSYLKLAWKVLLRHRFFTAISLFGISFTLMILLVVLALVDHVAGAHAPEKRIDRMLFAPQFRQYLRDGGYLGTACSSAFIDRYVRTLHGPERVALTSNTRSVTSFANGQSQTLDLRYTDGNFWQVMDFAFLAGRPFTQADVRDAAPVCVVNEHTARLFFGSVAGAGGHYLESGPYRYRVVGVVPDVPTLRLISSADLWVPYTLSSSYAQDRQLAGDFIPILLLPSARALPAARAEYQQMMQHLPNPDPRNIVRLQSFADPALGALTRVLSDHDDTLDDGSTTFWLLGLGLGLFFMLLPALNLINLNVTRILERASEIGVRKAFGASARVLAGQFLVENLVVSGLGGLLGLALAAGALHLLNYSHLFAYAEFGLDWAAFGWALGLALVFGLVSGVYPAWKMARLPPLVALRHGGGGGGPQ